MLRTTRISGIIVLAAIIGFAGFAFANGGGMMGGGSMMGSGTMGGSSGFGESMLDLIRSYTGRMGNGGNGDLSQRESARVQRARDNFLHSTRQLRSDIRDKQSSLKNELGKTAPDKDKVNQLREELFRLQSIYDQKLSAYERENRNATSDREGDESANPSYGYDR